MLMADEKNPLSGPERLFKSYSPWIGTAVFCVSLYYVLHRNQEVPGIIFAICGMMMGLGKAIDLYKGVKP